MNPNEYILSSIIDLMAYITSGSRVLIIPESKTIHTSISMMAIRNFVKLIIGDRNHIHSQVHTECIKYVYINMDIYIKYASIQRFEMSAFLIKLFSRTTIYFAYNCILRGLRRVLPYVFIYFVQLL